MMIEPLQAPKDLLLAATYQTVDLARSEKSMSKNLVNHSLVSLSYSDVVVVFGALEACSATIGHPYILP